MLHTLDSITHVNACLQNNLKSGQRLSQEPVLINDLSKITDETNEDKTFFGILTVKAFTLGANEVFRLGLGNGIYFDVEPNSQIMETFKFVQYKNTLTDTDLDASLLGQFRGFEIDVIS